MATGPSLTFGHGLGGSCGQTVPSLRGPGMIRILSYPIDDWPYHICISSVSCRKGRPVALPPLTTADQAGAGSPRAPANLSHITQPPVAAQSRAADGFAR